MNSVRVCTGAAGMSCAARTVEPLARAAWSGSAPRGSGRSASRVVDPQQPRGEARIVRRARRGRAPCRASPRTTGCRRRGRTTRRRRPGRAGTRGLAKDRRLARVLHDVAGLERRATRAAATSRRAGRGRCARARTARRARLRGERRRVVVGHRDSQILRRPAEALQRHHAAHGLQERIEAGPVRVRARGAERGHRAVDEPRIDRASAS